jgi:hypothetical protein
LPPWKTGPIAQIKALRIQTALGRPRGRAEIANNRDQHRPRQYDNEKLVTDRIASPRLAPSAHADQRYDADLDVVKLAGYQPFNPALGSSFDSDELKNRRLVARTVFLPPQTNRDTPRSSAVRQQIGLECRNGPFGQTCAAIRRASLHWQRRGFVAPETGRSLRPNLPVRDASV